MGISNCKQSPLKRGKQGDSVNIVHPIVSVNKKKSKRLIDNYPGAPEKEVENEPLKIKRQVTFGTDLW